MADKKNTPKEEKFSNTDFDLFGALAALDKKDYGYYSNLTQEQQKKFVPYMMLLWMSAVKGGKDLQGYYVLNTELCANKHFFNESIQQHPELQWLMLCAASPGIGKQFHQWIPHLTQAISQLKAPAKIKEVGEYFSKVYKGADSRVLEEAARHYVEQQNIKYRLGQIYTDLKTGDIDILATLVSEEEIRKYEEQFAG